MAGIFGLLLSGAVRVVDQFYEYVTLLLPGNGTNGAQNNTFLDGSTNNFTITRNGNTTQGTFSPFSQTGWGNYFNGSSQYLSTPDSTAFTMGSGDFTVEAWVYKTSTGRQFITGQSDSGGSNTSVSFALQVTASNKISGSINSGATEYAATSTADIVLNQWNHIAFVRDGNTSRIYVNGNQDGTASVTGITANDSTNQLAIGRLGEYNGLYWTGYISNCRIVKGRCVYPSGTTFNPPTAPLTRTTGGTNPPQGTECSLLTCQSNRFLDSNGVNTPASSPLTITPNGSPSVVAFSPFNPTESWSAATYGGSGYFDGSGDYLSTTYTGAISASQAFTFQTWVYPIGNPALDSGINIGNAVNSLTLSFKASNTVQIGRNSVGTIITSSNSVVANAWNHIAVSRNTSGTLRMWINGNNSGSTTDSGSFAAASAIYIGSQGATLYFTGYIASHNFVVGSTVFDPTSTSITVPTEPPTNITNTQFLLNFTNAGIYDATSKNDLETVGNAQISTAISAKWGSGSIKLTSASSDYLKSPSSNLYVLGTGDWTIECWVYLPSVATQQIIFDTRATGTDSGYAFYVTGVGKLALFTNNTSVLVTSSSVPSNSWAYLAMTRTGATVRAYINGTLDATTGTYSGSMNCPGTALVGAGAGGTDLVNGYIQDLRITKGYARTITTPTAAFPTL